MIQIVEAVPEDHCEINNRAIQQLYAFALNRFKNFSFLFRDFHLAKKKYLVVENLPNNRENLF